MHKLNMEEVAESIKFYSYGTAAHQVAVYVMCGGGMIGQMAAEQPLAFYVDTRVGRLPYPVKQIEQAVAVLIEIAKAEGINPKQMPKMPPLHNCGIW